MSAAPAVREQQVGVVLSLLTRLSPRQSLAAGAVALVALVAAYVYMSNAGMSVEGLLIFGCPIVATLLQQAGVNHVTAQQNAVLAEQPTSEDVRVIVGDELEERLPVVVRAAVLSALTAYAEAESAGVPYPRAELERVG